MPPGSGSCDSAAQAPAWFDGNQPDSLLECSIAPDGDADYDYGYQWVSDSTAPSQFMSELAADANGNGPTSVTQAGDFASCPELTVGEGCQFTWSGSNGSGTGLYVQAGYGNENLYWTNLNQGSVVFWIQDYSGGNDLNLAKLQLQTWWLTNVGGM
jgi:hypothetical protein